MIILLVGLWTLLRIPMLSRDLVLLLGVIVGLSVVRGLAMGLLVVLLVVLLHVLPDSSTLVDVLLEDGVEVVFADEVDEEDGGLLAGLLLRNDKRRKRWLKLFVTL